MTKHPRTRAKITATQAALLACARARGGVFVVRDARGNKSVHCAGCWYRRAIFNAIRSLFDKPIPGRNPRGYVYDYFFRLKPEHQKESTP